MTIRTAAPLPLTGLLALIISAASLAADVQPALPAVQAGPGAQFTFNVPVQLQALHQDNRSFIVTCSVGRRSPGDWIGMGREMLSLGSGGTFSGNVTVRVNVYSGRDPSEANVYRCGLQLVSRAANVPCPPAATTCSDASLRSKPGTPFRSLVEGSIP